MIKFLKSQFKDSIKRVVLRRNYYAMRGYRILKNQNRLADLDLLKSQSIESLQKYFLTDKTFKVDLVSNSNLQYGFVQYLAMTFCEKKLTYSLLRSVGSSKKVVLSVPPQVLTLCIINGWRVNILLSRIVWLFNIVKYFFYGIYKFIVTLWSSTFSRLNREAAGVKYVSYPDLNEDNLPNLRLNKSYDILTWFIDSHDELVDISEIQHPNYLAGEFLYRGKVILGCRDILPYFTKVPEYLLYVKSSMAHILLAAWRLLFGDWRRAILLSQVIDASRACALDNKKIATHYFFNNNSAAYRPLWSYVFECRGAKVIFYFYSFNNESYISGSKFSISHIWKNINWTYYLIWSEAQISFFRRSIGFIPKYKIVGPITSISCAPSSNLKVNLVEDSRLKVAVFDIVPYRDSFYAGFALDHDYLTPINVCKFLSDIFSLSKNNDVLLYVKKKKNSKHSHKKYLSFYDSLSKLKNVVIIDAGVAACELISHCDATISYPFTSTALIGQISGVQSIYYDATSTISSDIPCGYGVQLVSGLDNLDLWFKKLKGSEKCL